MRIIFLISISLLVLSGCQTPTTSQTALQRSIIPVSSTDKTVPIAFEKIVIKLPRGRSVGNIQLGPMCTNADEFRVKTGKYRLDDDSFTDIFREELINANYEVVGDPDSLFNDPSRDRARYLIAGLVTEIEAHACFPNINLYGQAMLFKNPNASKGAAFMKVEWQIFDTRSREVVLKTESAGSSQITTPTSGSVNMVTELAFSVAVNNLMAVQQFHDLLTEKSRKTIESAMTNPFELVDINVQMADEEIDKRSLETIKDSVVTIKSALGHGSGFIISDDGYILTNAHVVGGADVLAVTFENGMEVEGIVIRKDPLRDVALIKIPLTNLKPLSLKLDRPTIGSSVYAVGSPIQTDLHGTISAGIVSAYRVEENTENELLQSDTSIIGGNSGGPMVDGDGNVVAISVSGYSAGNVNFFIPIDSALEKLNIR